MKVRNSGGKNEKVEIPMTPMIDIVFQLLVFFIMTFKIVSQEGDFNIKMPLAAPSERQRRNRAEHDADDRHRVSAPGVLHHDL
jgi:biopolymer transport protein ExbD